MGASAGGVEALIDLVSGLDPATDAALLVVLHQPAEAPTVLPHILSGHSALPVVHAEHGAPLRPGHVHLALPDHHLAVRDGHVLLSHGPKENGHRPAVDPLLRSLAVEAGPGSIGVILSGMLDDGAAGLLDVVRHGGTALVQDPDEALYPAMPTAALARVPGARTRRARELGTALRDVLAHVPTGEARPSHRASYELHMAGWDAVGAPHDPDGDDPTELEPPGPAAGLACPDCAGPLFDLSEGDLLRYRCRVGHAWSQASLDAEQGRAVEVALYTAMRALEDKASLQRRVAATAEAHGATEVARRARHRSQEALRSASDVRRLVTGSLG